MATLSKSENVEPLPGSSDGVDIAMEAAANDLTPNNPSRLLLQRQAGLIEAQVRQLGRQRWRDLIVTALGAILLISVGAFVWSAAASNAVVVGPFDSPPALAERGLTPKVLAGTIQDAISTIQASNVGDATRRNIDNAWTNQITVQVPNTGVSISDVDRMLRAQFSNETHVDGAVVINADGTLGLTVRATGVPPQTFTGPADTLAAMTTKAAEYVYGRFEPRLFSRYLVRFGRADEALILLETAYPLAPEDQRADLAAVWGNAFAAKGKMFDAAARYRFALQLDPYNWTAATNIIGALYDTEGEEGAARMGKLIEDRIRMAPSDKKPGASTNVLQNYQILVGDWTGFLTSTQAWIEATNGVTPVTFGDAALVPALAEAQGRRHDYPNALHLLANTSETPSKRAVQNLVYGYSMLERGEVSKAIPAFERVKQTYDTDGDFKFAFPSAPCWLGLAYGKAGRFAEARLTLEAGGKWTECYAFAAVVEEAAGNRSASDAADRRAKALSPSLPTPYFYRGLTLRERGNLAGAEKQFALASARGPRWADPLKLWGDVLAEQDRWIDAKVKYDAAAPFAPNWPALAKARRHAASKAAKQTWWPFD